MAITRPKDSQGKETLSMPTAPTPPDSAPVPLSLLFNSIWESLAHLHDNGTAEPPTYLKEGGLWARPYDGGKQILQRIAGSGQDQYADAEIWWMKNGDVSFPIGSTRNLPLELTDLNDLKSTGLYWIKDGLLNLPTDVTSGNIWVQKNIRDGVDTYYQMLMSGNSISLRNGSFNIVSGVFEWVAWSTLTPAEDLIALIPKLSDAYDSDASDVAASSRAVKSVYEKTGTSSAVTLRNLILEGKNKDGQPAFLIGQDWLRTPHQGGKPLGPLGKATVSSTYDTTGTYSADRPFSNQIVYTGGYWVPANGSRTGWVEYAYSDAFVPTGLNFVLTSDNAQIWPTSFAIEGYDEAQNQWDVLYANTDFKRQHGAQAGSIQPWFGTTVWFRSNTKSYHRLRYRVLDTAGTHIQLQVLRFFTCEHINLSPFDVVLDASPEQPLKVSIAKGATGDKIAVIDRPVLLPGKLFYEMARNYLYVVPANADGTAPDYIDEAHAVDVPEAGVWLWISTKKIDYSATLDELKSKSLLVFQSNDTANRTVTNEVIRANTGYWDHELLANVISSDITKGTRGAPSSWKFGAGTTSWLVSTPALPSQVLQPSADVQPGEGDFTLQLDFAYTGPAETTAGYYVLFDAGVTAGGLSTFAVSYDHQVGQIRVSNSGGAPVLYAFPFVARNGTFYTLSMSVHNRKLFMHIDGECIGFYDSVPSFKVGSSAQYAIGRWLNYGTNAWPGYINNIHYILGQALHQSENYVVQPIFHEDTIAEGACWWNYWYGAIQQYSQETRQWADTPMLALGHIDTGNKEHLHTWQPRGTNGTYNIMGVKAFTTNGQYDANYPAGACCNFGEGGLGPYLTPSGIANNTTAYWVQLELKQSLAFDELRLSHHGDNNWMSFPSVFTWQASNDNVAWTTLINRSTFVRDGNPSLGVQHFLGNVHNINGQKIFKYNNTTKYKYYRMTLLPKGAIPSYNTVYSGFRAQFSIAGGTPEIMAVQSYAIGDRYAAPVFMMTVGTDYVVPVPFGGAPFDVRAASYVVEINDFEKKRRPLGQSTVLATNQIAGEFVYQKEDSITVSVGAYTLSLYNGNGWSPRSVNASSSYANCFVIARRIY